jgi:hypothetical protein
METRYEEVRNKLYKLIPEGVIQVEELLPDGRLIYIVDGSRRETMSLEDLNRASKPRRE